MPTKDRTMKLYRELLEAALDQPRPSAALKSAAAAVMKAIEHSLVKAVEQADSWSFSEPLGDNLPDSAILD